MNNWEIQNFVLSRAVMCREGDFVCRSIWQCLETSLVVTIAWEDAPNIQLVEASGAANHPAMYKTPDIKNYPAPNVNMAATEKF